MLFVVLCPRTPEGSTGSGSGFKAARLQLLSKILKNWKGNFSEANIKCKCDARTLKKVTYYYIKHWLSTIMSLFKLELFLRERICSQREQIQFLVVWEFTFITLGELP